MRTLLFRACLSLCLLLTMTAFKSADFSQATNQESFQTIFLSTGDCTQPDLCPPPPGANHIMNGGLNNYATNPKIPTKWTAKNFGTSDGKSTTIKLEGTASVKIVGKTGITKTLTQSINLSGTSGDIFAVIFNVKGKSIPNTTGLCQLQVLFYDGLTKVETKTVKCSMGTYGFEQKYLYFLSKTAYTKVVIKITYSKPSGTLWIDDIWLAK